MNKKKVAVLLSSYNGEKYIEEQIESVLQQDGVDVTLFIRDDGSSDGTLDILEQLKSNDRCRIYLETNVGVVKSFFELLNKAKEFDYYAFCDQDDVWDLDKLKVAVDKLEQCNKPYLMYYSKTLPVDSNLVPIVVKGTNPDEEHLFNMHEILLRNNAIGCTMVINDRLRDKITVQFPQNVIMHDHWIYAVCRALDGDVFYDKTPHIKYRQHGSNVIGHKMTVKAKLQHSSFSKNKRVRSGMAKELLDIYFDDISDKNKDIILNCANYRNTIVSRIKLISQEASFTKNYKKRLFFIIQVMTGVY